jgi:hypothetical protein
MAALTPPAAGPRAVFPPEVAIHAVRLACEHPEPLGRSVSPGDGAERAHQRLAEGSVERLSAATVRRLLAGPHLQPWRQHLGLSPKPPRDAVCDATITALLDRYTRPLQDDEMVLVVDEQTSWSPASHATRPAREPAPPACACRQTPWGLDVIGRLRPPLGTGLWGM